MYSICNHLIGCLYPDNNCAQFLSVTTLALIQRILWVLNGLFQLGRTAVGPVCCVQFSQGTLGKSWAEDISKQDSLAVAS
jgi:hypothetical protein